jgi:CheY-like chemotaxis protein
MRQILLIEPDKVLAASICSYLKKDGYSVDWQVDPQISLDRVDKKIPKAIVLDVELAGRSGIEFLYELRSYPEWQSIPVIFFSSLPIEEVKGILGSYDHLSPNDFLYKPVSNLRQLKHSIELALQAATA